MCQVVQEGGHRGSSSLAGVGRWRKGVLQDFPEELTLRVRMWDEKEGQRGASLLPFVLYSACFCESPSNSSALFSLAPELIQDKGLQELCWGRREKRNHEKLHCDSAYSFPAPAPMLWAPRQLLQRNGPEAVVKGKAWRGFWVIGSLCTLSFCFS